jgi:phage gpG-like protein
MDVRPAIVTVGRKFGHLSRQFRSLREPLKRSARGVINESIGQNFITGRPEWEQLDESTIENKGHARILIESGRLARASTALARWDFVGGYTAHYRISRFPEARRDIAWFHTVGTRNMPARPFVVLERNDAHQIEAVFQRWTEEKIRESGLG